MTIAYDTQLLLVARRSLPADSISELIQLAKSQPGRLIYGSPGSGTRAHVLVELLRHSTGMDLVHVPYKGGPASTAALLAGDVSFTIDAVSQLRPHIEVRGAEGAGGDWRSASVDVSRCTDLRRRPESWAWMAGGPRS